MTSHRVKNRIGIQRRLAVSILAGATLLPLSMPSQAIEFGPDGMFSLTGFAEATTGFTTNYCVKCQVASDLVSKQLQVADAIIPGKKFDTVATTFWQVQPYLGFKYDLGRGFEASGLISQRWRDGSVDGKHIETRFGGKVDIPGFWYEKNLALSHEDYGSVRVGSMTTRSWSVADYPYGANLGISEQWGAAGAGYGMLRNAVRVAAPLLDVADGDLFLEMTYSRGDREFKRLKPVFFEWYAQFHKGDLVLDAMYQNAKNGGAGAWGHAPFAGVTPFGIDDRYVDPISGLQFDGNKQTVAMLMGRYQYNAKVEFSAGIRRNTWSGTDVVFSPLTGWTTGFNVDFTNPLAVSNPGIPARTVDFLLGMRYLVDRWIFSTGMVYFGKAHTSNPSDRGQNNTALFNSIDVSYAYTRNLLLELQVGTVHYSRLGLSPLSMPGNAAFSGVDSRVSKHGEWTTIGVTYTF